MMPTDEEVKYDVETQEPPKKKKSKEHRVLKVFMPLLSGIYGALISCFAGFFIMFDSLLESELKSMAVEIVFMALTFWLVLKLLPKIFPAMKNYSFGRPEWTLIVAILLCTPLYMVVKNRLIYYVAGIWNAPKLHSISYDWQELKSDLIGSLSVIILAPIYEELCFRFMPISIFKKKWSRIVVVIIMAFLFSTFHGNNGISVFIDGLVYGGLLLASGNAWTNICAHSCNNFYATILAVLTFFGAQAQMSEGSPLVLLLPWEINAVCAAMAAVGILVFIWGRRRKRSK